MQIKRWARYTYKYKLKERKLCDIANITKWNLIERNIRNKKESYVLIKYSSKKI